VQQEREEGNAAAVRMSGEKTIPDPFYATSERGVFTPRAGNRAPSLGRGKEREEPYRRRKGEGRYSFLSGKRDRACLDELYVTKQKKSFGLNFGRGSRGKGPSSLSLSGGGLGIYVWTGSRVLEEEGGEVAPCVSTAVQIGYFSPGEEGG